MRKGTEIQDAWKNIRVQIGQKDNIVDGLKNSFKYLPIIEDIFKENGLPWELTRIPFVESSFNIRANSKVGAIGIWQIMGDTGKNFMETKPVYDERYSPFKASAVAAKLLKENYESLKSWPLAITAYNHGPSGLKKASKQLRTKDIVTIISGYKGRTFGFASQNFYSEFLAALYVTVYYEKIFGHIEKGHPLSFYYVSIEKDIGVKDLSEISGLSVAELSSYNPEFSNKMLKGEVPVNKGRKVKLPPRASYKVEDYFVKISDKKELERELNINESEDD
jgi:membrane-bound lytic murein transglycosylase D